MGFVTEGVYLFSVAVFVVFTPEKFFSSKLVAAKDTVDVDFQDSDKFENKEQRVVSIFEIRQSSKEDAQKHSYFQEVKAILLNPVFFHANIARAIIQGINTALHYWIGDYMITTLGQNKDSIFYSYTIISIVGPLGGVLANWFSSICLGGYEHKHAPLALLLFCIISLICGISIPFMPSLIPFCVATGMFLLFSSAATPMVHGIILNSVGPLLKGIAFSITNFTTMLLTSGPYPFIYGAINDYYKERGHKNYAMLAIMGSEGFSIFFVLVLAYYRYKMFDVNKGKKEKLFEKEERVEGRDVEMKETE